MLRSQGSNQLSLLFEMIQGIYSLSLAQMGKAGHLARDVGRISVAVGESLKLSNGNRHQRTRARGDQQAIDVFGLRPECPGSQNQHSGYPLLMARLLHRIGNTGLMEDVVVVIEVKNRNGVRSGR